MKLLVLGATGRTGVLVVDEALRRGHQVVALVRDPTKLAQRPQLAIVQGTPENGQDVAKAIAGCDAVLVALNNQRESDFPWAKPRSPARLIENSMRNTVAAMQAAGVKRIVILSALGAAESFAAAPWIIRFLIRRSNVGISYADHDATDAYMRTASGIDWTLVRAVGLSNRGGDKALVAGTATEPKPGMMISRMNVARFMLDCAERGSHVRETPVISER